MQTTTTRESWLQQAADIILDDILLPLCAKDTVKPKIAVSVGFPFRAGRRCLAQCFVKAASDSGTVNDIFVTPELGSAIDMLAALTHELIHATDNCESGHRGRFAALAKKAGMIGKMTETQPNPELLDWLAEIAAELGTLPHEKININIGTKKQATRMLKLECSICQFTARTTKKWIEVLPAPAICPACTARAFKLV